jgi:transcriptional regulator with XRE-family HTH domain
VPPTTAQLGTTIRRARESRGLSIETLAAKADISWRYLSQIERGEERNNPTWVVLSGLAEGLGLEISELARQAEDLAKSESS